MMRKMCYGCRYYQVSTSTSTRVDLLNMKNKNNEIWSEDTICQLYFSDFLKSVLFVLDIFFSKYLRDVGLPGSLFQSVKCILKIFWKVFIYRNILEVLACLVACPKPVVARQSGGGTKTIWRENFGSGSTRHNTASTCFRLLSITVFLF